MRRSISSLLVIGLLVAFLTACGSSATGNQTGGTLATATVQQTVAPPTASSHAATDRIAWQGFLDPDQSTSAIFAANADGSDVRQLTHPVHGEQDGFPDWSPDGSKILFASVDVNGTSDIFVMNADGTGITQLTSCRGVCNGAQWGRWSPDGSKIVYSVADNPIRPDGNASVEALWIMNADGSHPVQFTHPPLPTSIADNAPAWSPDGRQILFARNHLVGQSYEDQALFVINRDGSGLKQLTAWGHLEAGNAQWSPDGKRILFQSFGSFPEGSIPQLYTILPDGTHLVQVTTNERNYEPAWSPDGTKIVFAHRSSTGADQNAHLYEMNADGSGLVQITRNPFWQRQPAWGPRP
jgi:TolB protein